MTFSWRIIGSSVFALAALVGCATLDVKQGAWIFGPTDRTWGNTAQLAEQMQDVWIPFESRQTGQPVKLHALWHASPQPNAPVLLYLHGARWNVTGSSNRIMRMQELGFSVLAVDYRGFGKTSKETPSEAMAYEDARAAWDWLAAKYPQRPRYIFGHSLGGAIAIDLAAQVADEAGTMVEGTFTSIPDVYRTLRWGWVPLGWLISQRFDAQKKVGRIGSPLLVMHGSNDRTILPELGRKLFEAAANPKRFVLVEGGSHHNSNQMGQPEYRQALADLFGLRTQTALAD
jgi:uncharacterized protein